MHIVEKVGEIFFATGGHQPLPHTRGRRDVRRRLRAQQSKHRWRKQPRVDREAHDVRLRRTGVESDATTQGAAEIEVGHVVQALPHGCGLQQLAKVLDVFHLSQDLSQHPSLVEPLVQAQGDRRATGLSTFGARQLGTDLVQADHLFHATGEHPLVGRRQQVDLMYLTEIGP